MTNFVTVPGIPNPIVASRTVAFRPKIPTELSNIPTGENVSKTYPWVSGFKRYISGVINAETRLIRTDLGSAALINNTNRNLQINELRFFSTLPTTADLPVGNVGQFMIANRLGLKVRHSDYEVVSGWIPSGMLQTHNNRIGLAARSDLCMTLPTPYYLQAGHPFRMRIRSTNPFQEDQADYTFGITLVGLDPRTMRPYEICKRITIPYISDVLPSDTSPQYVDVLFDDDRDYPMRDMLLTHITFGLLPYGSLNRVLVYNYAQQLEVQFMPPEGPKWMEFADWAPIASVVDQSTTPMDNSCVVYRPQVPMYLSPSQQIDIDIKALFSMFYLENQVTVTQIPLWVTLLGTQEQQVGQ